MLCWIPQNFQKWRIRSIAVGLVLLGLALPPTIAQKKTKNKVAPTPANTELARLREDYVKASNDYKASLEKLLASYENNVSRAEEKLAVSKPLLAAGSIARGAVQ